MSLAELKESLRKFLEKNKGSGEAALLVANCNIEEMPKFVVTAIEAIKSFCNSDANETLIPTGRVDVTEGATPELSAGVPMPTVQDELPVVPNIEPH